MWLKRHGEEAKKVVSTKQDDIATEGWRELERDSPRGDRAITFFFQNPRFEPPWIGPCLELAARRVARVGVAAECGTYPKSIGQVKRKERSTGSTIH